MSLKKKKNTPKDLVKRQGVKLPDEQGELLLSDDRQGDLYAHFVRQATRIPRLSEEEERLLGLKVRDHGDQEAAKKLVYHNMRLAIKMAHQYKRSWTILMDLVQEALAGMGIASKRWDPDEKTRFGTYAVYWIKAQLAKFLMTNSRLIHTGNSRAGRKIYFSLPKIRRELEAKGLPATPEIIAQELDEDPLEVALVLKRLENSESSLSAPKYDQEGISLQDAIASGEKDPEALSATKEIRESIQLMISNFEKTIKDKRDLEIWKSHLVSNEPISLVDLAKKYDVSKQRMGQLSDRVKKAFRRYVIDTLGPETQLSWLFSEDSVE